MHKSVVPVIARLAQITIALSLICAALVGAFMLVGRQLPSDQIAFDSTRSGSSDVYLLDVQRHLTLPLTRSPNSEFSAAWSPNGEYLAYVYNSPDDFAVYVMRANGRDRTRLTGITPTAVGASSMLAWSPDGSTIALTTLDDTTNVQAVFLINLDGSNLRRVSTTNGSAFSPTWSRNNQLAFASSPTANTEIYVVNVEQPDVIRRITNDPLTDTGPAWSPDGLEIAFSSDRVGNSEIFLMNPDGTDLRPITQNRARDIMPAWSPDSQWIVFVSNRSGSQNLFMMRRDGSEVRQLTFDRTNVSGPAWRP